jgi:hypothetical protein
MDAAGGAVNSNVTPNDALMMVMRRQYADERARDSAAVRGSPTLNW